MAIVPAEVHRLLDTYPVLPAVAVVGSHSAIDVADGAVAEGLTSLVLAERGRDAAYTQYFRTLRDHVGVRRRGCVDEVWPYPKFADLTSAASQERLRERGALLVPNRAFSSYVPLSVIEQEFRVPIVGSRTMLRIEERSERENYYALLDAAGVPTPRPVPASASDTSPLVIACTSPDLTTPACASDWAYEPNNSLMSRAPVNFPVPPSTSDLPKVMPPPLVLILTPALWPLLQVIVPLPLAVL